jgi:hypothetical protein
MHRRPGNPARRGLSVLGTVIGLVLLAGLAIAVSRRLDIYGILLDRDLRDVQRTLIGAQNTAVRRKLPVVVQFYYNADQIRISIDSGGTGALPSVESGTVRVIRPPAHIRIPPSTIDGAPPDFATGPGLTHLNFATPYPTITFSPTGSVGGNVVLYLGTKGRKDGDRFGAIELVGATSKSFLWRMSADGRWSRAAE